MRVPDEYLDEQIPITPREFHLAMVLYALAKDNLQVTVAHEVLERIMGVSSETIRVATQGLKQKGLIGVERKKRNRGFLGHNKYLLMADIDLRMREFRESRKADYLDWKYSAEGRRVHTSRNYVPEPFPTIDDTKTRLPAELNYLIKQWRAREYKRMAEWKQDSNGWGY